MTSRVIAGLVCVASAAQCPILFGALMAGAHSVIAAPTKVLPLGDSITFGCGDECETNCMDAGGIAPCSSCSGGFRSLLWHKLAGASNTSDAWQFVGSQQNGPAEVDRHHEGHPGWTCEKIQAISDQWAPTQPDVILLHLGTNNMGIAFQSAKTALEKMDGLLEHIFELLPDTRVLLATLIGSGGSYGGAKHAEYNSGLTQLVEQHSSEKRRITLVDMAVESGIGKLCDSVNCCPANIHPNDVGYTLMADVWHAHLTGKDIQV